MSILKSTLATLSFIVIYQLLSLWPFALGKKGLIDNHATYTLITVTIQSITVFLFINFARKDSLVEVFKSTKSKWFIWAAGLGLTSKLIQLTLRWNYNMFWGTEYVIEFRNLDFNKLNAYSLFYFFSPFIEEIFFRGYIQFNLEKKIKPYWGILITAILFSLIHAPYDNLFFEEWHREWYQTYATFFLGILSGYLFYKSKSLWPSIVLHFLWNSMSTLF